MKRRVLVILSVFVVTASYAGDVEDAGAKLHEYFSEFNNKNIETIANHIYSTPVHVGGGTGHRVLADSAAAIANLTDLYKQIEAQGWVESRIENLKICVASNTLALVDTRYSRIDQDGAAILPAIRTTLYVLQKIDEEWRIVAFYGHDNDQRPSCN